MNAPAPKNAVATPSTDDMQKRVARFADLVPYKDTMNDVHGIPPEAMQMMSSDKVYPVMSPEGWEGRSKVAPVKGAAGLTVTIAECPPGDSSGLHKHTATVENFFCIQGTFDITWGDEGENSVRLEPMDFISVPAGIYREFTNVGSMPAPPVKRSSAAGARTPATPWPGSVSSSGNSPTPTSL
jgi:quercetin dioxygenase-like cupin family protein